MATMKAAFFDGEGKMEVREIPKPEAGPGDMILRVRSVGICGSDLQMNVDKTEPDQLPAGHEVAGEIVEIGDGVDPSALGKRVAVEIIGHGRACTTLLVLSAGTVPRLPEHGSVRGRRLRRVHEAQGDRLLPGP